MTFMYYVYEWFNKDTGYIFYVGKGCKNRFNSTSKRNKLFKKYIKENNCDCRILQTYSSEEKAFVAEHERIMVLKQEGQAGCNLDLGGKGGCNFVWTDEMRKYKSEYNPMKEDAQRKRMSFNNPMKNKNIAHKVGLKHSRPVVIDGTRYSGVLHAARALGKAEPTIREWCKRGYNSRGKLCRYENEPQKEVSAFRKAHPLSTRHKAVIIDDKLFYTVLDGASFLDISSQKLVNLLKQGRSLKGHTCSYADQQPSRKNTI